MKRKTITKKRSVCVLAAGFFACAALLNPFAAGSEKVLADEQVPSHDAHGQKGAALLWDWKRQDPL